MVPAAVPWAGLAGGVFVFQWVTLDTVQLLRTSQQSKHKKTEQG